MTNTLTVPFKFTNTLLIVLYSLQHPLQSAVTTLTVVFAKYIKLHLPRRSILTINDGDIVLPTTWTGWMLHHINTVYHSWKTFNVFWKCNMIQIVFHATEVHLMFYYLILYDILSRYFVIMGYVEEVEELRQQNYSKKECWYFCLNCCPLDCWVNFLQFFLSLPL
jgi:hypothetical protein